MWARQGEPLKINKNKRIYQIDSNGKVTEWFNMNIAAKELNIPCSAIYKCCIHDLISTNNYIFVFYDDYVNHNYDISKIKFKRQVTQYDLNMNYLVTYKNVAEAGRSLKIDRKQIAKCCKQEITSYKDFVFKYI